MVLQLLLKKMSTRQTESYPSLHIKVILLHFFSMSIFFKRVLNWSCSRIARVIFPNISLFKKINITAASKRGPTTRTVQDIFKNITGTTRKKAHNKANHAYGNRFRSVICQCRWFPLKPTDRAIFFVNWVKLFHFTLRISFYLWTTSAGMIKPGIHPIKASFDFKKALLSVQHHAHVHDPTVHLWYLQCLGKVFRNNSLAHSVTAGIYDVEVCNACPNPMT